MSSLPAPIRATLGLLATALDTVQELVEHAPELPMEAVGNSMQLSLRIQQHYVALLTRGDEFLANLRGAPEEAPAWATFDESPAPQTAQSPAAEGTFSSDDADVDDLPAAHREGEARHAGQGDPLLDAVVAATAPPAKRAAKSAAKAAAPGKVAAKKAPANKAAPPAKKAAPPAKKAAPPAKKAAPSKRAPATVAPAAKAAPVKKAVPARKSAVGRKASPEPAAPAKRATPRRARRAPAAAATAETEPIVPAVPTLDAGLDSGRPSARQLSAFDLVGDDADAPVTDLAVVVSPATVAIDVTPTATDDASSDGSGDSSDAS